MNPDAKQPFLEINIKDLLFVLVRKAGIAFLVGFILSGAMFGYKIFTGTNDSNILDASVRLDGETDAKYMERVQSINRAKDIINSINAINGQIDSQREYVANSVIMQIDAMNEAVTTAQYVITIDDNKTNGMDSALVSSYSQDLMTGEYLADLADELGTEQGYLVELIKVEYDKTTSVVVNTDGTSGNACSFKITVVGPTTDYTDKIMDCILGEVVSVYADLNSNMIPHTIALAGRQSSYTVDSLTRDLQYNAANRFEALQKQIDLYNISLDDLATKLGVSDKEAFYTSFALNDNDDGESGPSLGTAIKFALIAFAFGVLVVMLIVVMDYLFAKRFATQSKFFGRFPGIKKIGVARPAGKRSAIIKFIDRKTGDDSALSDENSNKLLAANIKNLTAGMGKVLFTGTAEVSKIKDLVKELDIKADVKASFFEDPSCLESVSEYDGIIIVEQRDYSDCKLVNEELKLISNTSAKLIGAVVI